jgi:hypothetical protein
VRTEAANGRGAPRPGAEPWMQKSLPRRYTCRETGRDPRRSSIGGVMPAEGGLSATTTGDPVSRVRAEALRAGVVPTQRSGRRNRTEARLAVFDYIEGFYNTHRRHSALGQVSPREFERRYADQPKAA